MSAKDVVIRNIGSLATLTTRGDLFFYGELRPYIGNHARRLLRIVKLTKGGNALLVDARDRRQQFSVAPSAVEPIEL